MSSDDSEKVKVVKEDRRGFMDLIVGAGLFGGGFLANDYFEDKNQQADIAPPPEISNTPTPAGEDRDSVEDDPEDISSSSDPTPYPKDTPASTPTQTPDENPLSPPAETTTRSDTTQGSSLENPNNYGWTSQEDLYSTTGFCYLEDPEAYLGTMDGSQVEEALEEGMAHGKDPNGALTEEQINMDLEDVTSIDGLYAVDIDMKSAEEDEFYVQLVGEEDGGLYVTKEGAYELSELEFEDRWNSC